MKNIQDIRLKKSGNEELLPDFSPEFPYIASKVLMDRYVNHGAPWHWHRAVELFHMESGTLEYTTPSGKWLFPAGSGGMVNSFYLSVATASHHILWLFEPDSGVLCTCKGARR